MQTTTLINPSNVEGNIGSCLVKNEQVIFDDGFWKTTGTNIATNSCTGEVHYYPYSGIGIGATFVIIMGVILLLGLFFAVIAISDNY